MRLTGFERLRYLRLYLLPALALVLILGGSHLVTHDWLKDDLRRSSTLVGDEFDYIAESARFSTELRGAEDEFQRLLLRALEGELDGAAMASVQLEVASRLGSIEHQLQALRAGRDDALAHSEAIERMQRYRNAILAALTHAPADPFAARAHGEDARATYLDLAVRIDELARAAATRASDYAHAMHAHLVEQLERGFLSESVFVLLGVLLWMVFAFGLTRRLRTVSVAMQRLARGEFELPEAAELQGMQERPAGILKVMADAVLSFRAALIEQRDSQALLNMVLEESPYAIELVDADTMRFLKANASSRRLLGYSEEALQGMSVADIQAEMSAAELTVLGERIRAVGSAQFDTRHRRANGEIFDARVSVRIIHLHGTDYLLGIWQDVTAEKAAQAEIGKLSLVIEQSPNAVIITDIDANIEYVNDAFVRKTGYPREEVVGRNPRLLQSGRTPTVLYEEMWSTLRRGAPWRGEFINLSKSGEEQIERAIIAPLRRSDGTVTHYVAVKEDITEEKAREQERNQLFLAVEQSPDSIVITNLDACIEYVNKAFLDNTGYSREEVIGLNPRVLQTAKTPKATYVEMWQTLTRGEPWRGELFNRRKDGSEYVELAHIAPVRQPDGRITHYLAIKQDITEKRRMAEELDQHRHHLERLVVERSAELISAKEAAEVANRAKSAFLANMSHEIRTPMNAIIGFTHLLKRDSDDPQVLAHLARIDEAAHHLLQIINDVLDLSKIEAGRIELDHVDFAPLQVIEQAVAIVRDQAERKGLALTRTLGPLPAVLRGDALRIGQVLLNLLSNAVKFTEAGHVTLGVRTLSEVEDGGGEVGSKVVVRFEVGDSGIGLTEAQRTRLFQPFEQGDRSTTRKYGGTGLGLAISRQLVELMGGRIGVDSQLGVGSRFWFELPLLSGRGLACPAGGGTALSALAPEHFVHFGPYAWAGSRVLLAEDDPVNQELAVALLNAVGFVVDVAGDGRQAVAMAQLRRYDLILLDMQMPEMDGLAAARAIRGLPSSRALPILAMTASAFEEDRRLCMDAGMDDHIVKPVEPQTLYQTIMRWLQPAMTPGVGVLRMDPARQCLPRASAPNALETAPRPSALCDGCEGCGGAGEMGVKPAGEETVATLRRACAGIDGLDVDVGLRYAGGMCDLYVNLLRLFVADRQSDSLPSLLESGDWGSAQRVVHTFKSMAATLGANVLRECAARLEMDLAAQATQGVEAFSRLDAQATALVESARALREALRSALQAREACEGLRATAMERARLETSAIDWGAMQELFGELDELLLQGDLAVRERFSTHETALARVLGGWMPTLAKQIEEFEFEEAAATLRAVIAAEPRLQA